MDMHFDLTRDARRTAIAGQLRKTLGEAGWAAVTADAARAGVPKRHHHDIGEVRATIEGLNAPLAVKESMLRVYGILADAEALVHGRPVEETHFHEVGDGERILNTLGICFAFDQLGPGCITSTPVQTGSGQVQCAHGLMDIPTPATAAILAQGIPICEEKLEGELCTPTSAAIIKYFLFPEA